MVKSYMHALEYSSLEEGYRAMSNDHEREQEAREWLEGLHRDMQHGACFGYDEWELNQ